MKSNPAAGLVRLARFRPEGLAYFDVSPTGLLNALTPWFAFALVGAALALFNDSPLDVLTALLASMVALLSPVVVSHVLARAWGREVAWLRYAVAMTWCQWVFPPALILAGLFGGVLMTAGLPEAVAEALAATLLIGYALALQLFLARRALDLGRGRAALLVIAVNIVVVVLVYGPTFLAQRTAA